MTDSTFFGKFILLVLLVLSVMSWAVFIDKARTLARIREGHLEFWIKLRELAGQPPTRASSAASWPPGAGTTADLPLSNLILETEISTPVAGHPAGQRAGRLPGDREPGTLPDPAVDRGDHLALSGPAGHGVGHHELLLGHGLDAERQPDGGGARASPRP